jgi:hypothetical protein
MGVIAEFTGGRTDVLTAAPITGVLPRTTTALAPTTPRPTTTVGTMGGGSGGDRNASSWAAFGRHRRAALS